MHDALLISKSQQPNQESQGRAIKQFLAPKTVQTKKADIIANSGIFPGGVIITAQKKVRPALLPTSAVDGNSNKRRVYVS